MSLCPSHALPSHALPSHALPSHNLLLIGEYSKPLTRPDWKTFTRTITHDIFINDSDKLNTGNTIKLYKKLHRNRYDHIYSMTSEELIEHLHNQSNLIKKLIYDEKINIKHERMNIKIAMKKLKNETNHYVIIKLLKKQNILRRTINNTF